MSDEIRVNLTDVLKAYSPTELAKAAADAYGQAGIRNIKDMWANEAADLHKIPSERVIKTGPPMFSSGSGADHAMRFYSNPAAQTGLMEDYREFDSQIANFDNKIKEMGKSYDEKLVGIEKSITDMKEVVGSFAEAARKAKEEDEREKKRGVRKSVRKAYNEVAELEVTIGKAEDMAAGEQADIHNLNEAREHLDSAEGYLEEVQEHETAELASMAHGKARIALEKAWGALLKAERHALTSYHLNGWGNQADSAIPGDEEEEVRAYESEYGKAKSLVMKAMKKHAELKALKAKNIRKSDMSGGAMAPAGGGAPVVSHSRAAVMPGHDEAHDMEPKAKFCTACGKAGHPDAKFCAHCGNMHKEMDGGVDMGKDAPQPPQESETPAEAMGEHEEHAEEADERKEGPISREGAEEKAHTDKEEPAEEKAHGEEPKKEDDFKKAIVNRVAELDKRLSALSNKDGAKMVPIIFKSASDADSLLPKMIDRLTKAQRERTISDEGASLARNLLDQFRASVKGHIPGDIVRKRLEMAPEEVRAFFTQAETEMVAA